MLYVVFQLLDRRSLGLLVPTLGLALMVSILPAAQGTFDANRAAPQLESELVFPLEHWHNHASMIVEAPNGDLLVCWFHGSGERTADDVVIRGARLRKGAKTWSEPFLLADTPGYPDTNATMFIDPRQRLWLLWPTILANEWHTALMKYRISSDYLREGPPRWDVSDVLHVTPGDEFKATVDRELDRLMGPSSSVDVAVRQQPERQQLRRETAARCSRQADAPPGLDDARAPVRAGRHAADRAALLRRLQLLADGDHRRLGRDVEDQHAARRLRQYSAVAGAEEGRHAGRLHARQRPGAQAAARQPIARPRRDVERGRGHRRCRTPAPVRRSSALANGHWVLVYNDLEQGRYSLAVSLSEDEGATWPWTRHLERDPPTRRPAAARASITTRRSFRPRTARCTPATATSFRRRRRRKMREGRRSQGDQARALQRGVDSRAP